ncbi:hypothetical protein [Cryptosporangium arvum]|uniref:Uncharacterized protein n=1 Tax=Cryptosporangium arvum DSM 44712 TaxID=927661 RepID=A0A011AGZ8_9ACTN|nr:hypothetical protein [Cryptosporangium arvum]EXG81261.1 hypothetical protein CryarDRAFT_2370 [Cryptosporangium arvum DSM 44712]
MSDAYTVFWPSGRCQAAEPRAEAGTSLEILFGGRHQSLPSFARAGVAAGDVLYPVTVSAKRLFVLGKMTVERLVTADVFALSDAFPQWRFLIDSCMSEAVLGCEGTPLRLDAPMAVEALRRLTYRSTRGSRTLRHLGPDGELLRTNEVQGIYRVDPTNVADLDAVLVQPPSDTRCVRSGTNKRQAKADADRLFWHEFSRPSAATRPDYG